MRIPSPTSVLATTAAFAVLAGCSGGGSPIAPVAPGRGAGNIMQRSAPAGSSHRTAMKTFIHPEALRKPLIFVSDELNNVVNVYLQARKNQQVGQITGLSFPGGLATDAARNLYVSTEFPAHRSR